MSTPISWLRPVFSNAIDSFSRHRLPRLAATLAYYTLFSVAPLLVISLVIAGSVLGQANVASEADTETQVYAQLENFVGESVASTIESLVTTQQNAESDDSRLATLVGAVVLFIGASGMFQALQDALNTVWDIPIDDVRGFVQSLIRRVYGVVAVFVIGLLMSVFVVGATVLTLVIPDWAGVGIVVRGLNLVIGFFGVSVVTALMFQWLPARKVPWRAAWAGGVLTTLMLVLGSLAIGLLIAYANPGAAFGQFAAIIVLLVYIYYSAQIFLFGAELTAAYVQVRVDQRA
jgi:membrane protein